MTRLKAIRLSQPQYLDWCKDNDFKPMLPALLAAEKANSLHPQKQLSISQFTVHQEQVVPYSDERFKQAALEWLVATDQVL